MSGTVGGAAAVLVQVVVVVACAPLLVGVLAVVLKAGLLAVLLATVEVFLAKLRLFRVPELLTGSCVLAFLAVTGSYVVG